VASLFSLGDFRLMEDFKSLLKIVGWLSIAGSILFLTVAFFLYRQTESFVRSASRTQGTVTKLVYSGKDSFPIYMFKDSRGVEHTIKSLSGSYPAAYQVGDKVGVIYQPDKPDNAEIDQFFDVWIWPIAFAGFGVLFLLFRFVVIVFNFFSRSEKYDPVA